MLRSVIDEVNCVVAADSGLYLVLSRWETDTHPGFHSEGPQGLIDSILKVTDCDLFLGIFWKRFGTPTADGKSGTETRIQSRLWGVARKRQSANLVYFNLKPTRRTQRPEAEQWGQVIDFRARFPKEGLWRPYKGKAHFEKLVRDHLTSYIRSLIAS